MKIYSRLIATLFAKSILENSGGGNNGTSEQVVFTPYGSFPETGSTERLYIATDEKEAYIWSEQNQMYEKIGGNSTAETDIIQSIL